MYRLKPKFFYATVLLIAVSCQKENLIKNQSLTSSQVANAVSSVCDDFSYGDSIFYVRPADTGDYVIKPLKKQIGTYGASPLGLRINSVSGSINVTKSETGLEYVVWFTKSGTTDTCKKLIKISGVDYNDTIYVMSQGTAFGNPIYNSNTSLKVDCSGGCEFDDGHDDDNGNGFADEPPTGQEVSLQGIVINKANGKINFSQSIKNGALGINPVDGAEKDFTLNYRIGDKSKKALNKVSFTLFYYKNKADIPAKLLEDLNAKQDGVIRENDDDDDGDHGGHHGSGFNINNINLSAVQTSKHGQGEVKCRPPYIIVTQN